VYNNGESNREIWTGCRKSVLCWGAWVGFPFSLRDGMGWDGVLGWMEIRYSAMKTSREDRYRLGLAQDDIERGMIWSVSGESRRIFCRCSAAVFLAGGIDYDKSRAVLAAWSGSGTTVTGWCVLLYQ